MFAFIKKYQTEVLRKLRWKKVIDYKQSSKTVKTFKSHKTFSRKKISLVKKEVGKSGSETVELLNNVFFKHHEE